MKNIVIKVEGMKCSGCENRIEKSLLNLEGIKKVSASYENGTVMVELSKHINSNMIKERLEILGFPVIGEKL
ncbi:MAG: heavy-metal-associated domain-containing protein [Bacilli bacterium]|nr:heavy-metal-associated domain-containing protein [Bacilli bacterium]